MNKAVLAAILLCVASMAACISCSRQQEQDNVTVAFQYFKPSQDEIDFLSRFNVVVTDRFLDAGAVKLLKSKKVKLVHYEWLPASYYCSDHTGWEEMVYQNRNYWTLDPAESDPNPLGDRYGCLDLFYDMADDDMLSARIDHIVAEIQTHQYDGVFFDWGSGWYAFQEHNYQFLMKEFQKRHPGIDYNEKANVFLGKLKENKLLIMVNGGFRSDGSKMDTHADFDVVESMFTTTDCKRSYELYTPMEGLRKSCETTFNTTEASVNLASSLPAKARSVNHGIRFVFLNYAYPYFKDTGKKVRIDSQEFRVYSKAADRQAIYYDLACSYLGGSSGFVSGPEVSLDSVMDNIYFSPIGKAEGEVKKIRSEAYLRYFSQGLVVISQDDTTLEVTLPGSISRVFDLYEGKYQDVKNNKLVVNLASQIYPSGSKHPVGRIYRYEH